MKRSGKGEYRATTVKLEAPVVQEVAKVLEDGQTLTAFVREAVLRDARKKKMRGAALRYREILLQDADEAKDMKAWETALLASSPASRKS